MISGLFCAALALAVGLYADALPHGLGLSGNYADVHHQLLRSPTVDLDQLLRVRPLTRHGRLTLELATVMGLMAAGIGLAVLVTGDLNRKIAVLSRHVERMVAGELDGETPLTDDAHDLGRLARSVDALRGALIEADDVWAEVLANAARYALITENMRDAVLLTDPAGEICFASPSAETLTADVGAVAGDSVWALFDDHVAARLRAELADQRKGVLARAPIGDAQWDVRVRKSAEDDDGLVFVLSRAA